MLKKLENQKEINEFGRYKVELIKEHQAYANTLGLYDIVVDKYDIHDALKHINQKNYYQFLISITNHNKENLDEKVEGLMYNKELLSKAMIEAFKKSKCYKLKSEEERNIIINFIKGDPLVEDPFIWV